MLEPRVPNLHSMQAVDAMRRRELLGAVRDARLTRQVEPSPTGRLLTRVGDLLIVVGKRLQARYVSVASPTVETCYVDC